MWFLEAFCTQLTVTYEWQPAQPAWLSATCEWHNQYYFHTKKHGEIYFKKQVPFCVSREKAMHKHIDEIDARRKCGSQKCLANLI
jgi:hypothetical protein